MLWISSAKQYRRGAEPARYRLLDLYINSGSFPTNFQSTSSIFDASSAAPSTSSSGGRSSSPRPSSSSSMLGPSLIIRWMRPANCVGSSRLKPEVNSEVSKRSQIKSLTVLSDLSAAAFFLSSVMMECFGFTSMVFFDTMYEVMELSRKACAFIIRSMFADHPYSEVVRKQGE